MTATDTERLANLLAGIHTELQELQAAIERTDARVAAAPSGYVAKRLRAVRENYRAQTVLLRRLMHQAGEQP